MTVYRRLPLVACLFAAGILPSVALEVEVRIWSPISLVVNTVLTITLDDDGLVTGIDQQLNRNSVRHADRNLPLDLEAWIETDVELTSNAVVQTSVDFNRSTTTTRAYRLSENRIDWQIDADMWVVYADAPGQYDVFRAGDLTFTARVADRSLEYTYLPTDVRYQYEWAAMDPLLTIVRTHPQARWTAYGTYDAEADTLTIIHPIEDDPSPYQAKYEITNARALLRQRFTPTAAALNNWIIPSDRLVYLRPLFTVGGLME